MREDEKYQDLYFGNYTPEFKLEFKKGSKSPLVQELLGTVYGRGRDGQYIIDLNAILSDFEDLKRWTEAVLNRELQPEEALEYILEEIYLEEIIHSFNIFHGLTRWSILGFLYGEEY